MIVGLKSTLARVDEAACDRLAAWLREHDIPADREEVKLDAFSQSEAGNFFFAIVAFCHQTSPRGRPPLAGTVGGRPRHGWDYLLARFREAVCNSKEWLTPDRWSRTTASDLVEMFRDPWLGDRLHDPETRAALLRDLGSKMVARGWAEVGQLQALCGGRVATGSPCLLDELSTFQAYSDPVRKKSLFFLSLMRNSVGWRLVDEHLMGPPVDYHEVRGHLRIGTVQLIDPELRRQVEAGEPVDPRADIAIRQAVYDAIMVMSERSGLRDPSRLHYLFWNVFRRVCMRDAPQCQALYADAALPERYMRLAIQPDGRLRCPFAGVCASSRADRWICEHVFETDYY